MFSRFLSVISHKNDLGSVEYEVGRVHSALIVLHCVNISAFVDKMSNRCICCVARESKFVFVRDIRWLSETANMKLTDHLDVC